MQANRFPRGRGAAISAAALSAVLAYYGGWTSPAPAEQPSPLPAEVEHAARLYRIEIYNTYRRQRSQYDQRRAAAEQVVHLWRQKGGPEEVEEVLRWFARATYNSRSDVRGPLPPPPSFSPSRQAPAERHTAATNKPKVDPSETQLPRRDQSQRGLNRPVRAATGEAAAQQVASREPLRRNFDPSRDIPQTPAQPEPLSRSPAPADVEAPLKATADAPEKPAEQRQPGPSTRDRVNLVELDAWIAGHNGILHDIEVRLIDPRPLSVKAVSRMLRQLERLLGRRKDIAHYLELLDDPTRNGTRHVTLAEPIHRRLSDRLDSLQERITGAEFAGTAAERETALQQVAGLRQRLEKMAAAR